MIDPLDDTSGVTVALNSAAATAALDAGAPLQLLVLLGGKVATYRLPDAGTVVIGRSRRCEVRIDDDSISRQHAVIHIGEAFTIEDLGGVNGTIVGGAKVAAPARASFAVGDLIQVGAASMFVQEVPETAADSGPINAAPDAPIVVEPAMRSLAAMTERIATSELSVLLLGETGVGKDVFARTIHAASGRSGQFVPINCAALSDTLLESELFGHERGAFTSAATAKTGLLETADNGTVLLDEVGDMPLSTQAKLLRVIEDREIRRVGSVTSHRINVRFVAATNRDLQADVDRGAFRRDLYFRLAGVTLMIPPLRERRTEIEPLARAFAERYAQQSGRPTPEFDRETVRLLQLHSWPGNIRELRNVIERAVTLCTGSVLLPEHVPTHRATSPQLRTAAGSSLHVLDHPTSDERERILAALERANGNQTLAAKLLNISRRTLINRLDEYGLPRPRK